MSVTVLTKPPHREILQGDALALLKTLPERSVQACVTSPPYWGLRDYGAEGQIGLESDPAAYVAKLVEVFREVRRVLKDDGLLWLNLGDSYTSGNRRTRATDAKSPAREMGERAPTPSGLKPKDLVGIPWRVAFALQADGWWLRSDIIWHKPNVMPESVTDRPTRAHEYVFMFSKAKDYYYDADAVREPFIGTSDHDRTGGRYTPPGQTPHSRGGSDRGTMNALGRNRRSVWSVNTVPFKGAHFATFPEALVEPCVKASTKAGDVVLDPFFGAGTVGVVAKKLGRGYVGIELNPEYVAIATNRIAGEK